MIMVYFKELLIHFQTVEYNDKEEQTRHVGSPIGIGYLIETTQIIIPSWMGS